MKMFRPCLAEFLGTFFLCFAGIAAILSDTMMGPNGGGIVAIALAHGLALSIAVNCFGGISGAHFNPAVTCGMLATGRIRPAMAGAYFIAQLLGATVAAVACKVFPADVVSKANLGIPLPSEGVSANTSIVVEFFITNLGIRLPSHWVSAGTIIVVEFILTFLLMTAIFGTAVDERGKAVKIGGFGIGLTVAFDILAGGALTGASMNPARSFGPALVQGHFDKHLLYWIAPIAGACVAALLYHHVILKEEPGKS